jgi:exopolyphosphatase/guanosine-5'-triphosphate,3'-diphosphate pyrophosphatase
MAFATSAIRDAQGGQELIETVSRESGVDLQVLSGRDEARLTYLAVRRWFGWSSGRLLVVDIGGGSLELASGLDEEPDAAISLPLGAGRLTGPSGRDLPKPKDIKAARAYVRAEIGGAVRELLRFGPPTRAVGTSKTIRSLARIAGAAPSGEGIYVTRRLRREHLGDIVKRLGRMSVARRRVAGRVATRPSLFAGALVVEAWTCCAWTDWTLPRALREGTVPAPGSPGS